MIPRLFIRMYVLILVVLSLLIFGVKPMVEGILKEESLISDRELVRGVFFLFNEKLAGLDEQGIRDTLTAIQPEFGHPIGLLKLDEIHLDEYYYKDLKAGLAVRDPKADINYCKLPGSNLVVYTGPHTLDAIIKKAAMVFRLLFFAILMVPVGIWAFYQQRSIKRIERVSDRFVAGDFSARLSPSGGLPMRKIASAFNHMAEKTQGLINSQKDLLNSVAHEIRTPLARIRFSVEMLGSKKDGKKGQEHYLGEIETDVTEISELVDEILTYERFERDRLAGEALVAVDLVAWLDDLIQREGRSTESSHMSLSFRHALSSRIYECDPHHLSRALKNVLRNAMYYGNTRVEMVFEVGEQGLHIHVDDDGPGIAEAEIPRIFEPFYRVDQSRRRDTGGYGLGLSIAKRIARWHGGTLSVATSPLGGARFTLTLPE